MHACIAVNNNIRFAPVACVHSSAAACMHYAIALDALMHACIHVLMSQLETLHKAMKAKGWDPATPEGARRLAEASGVHVTLVRRYLNGEVEVGAKNARVVAKALDITTDAILYGDKQPLAFPR